MPKHSYHQEAHEFIKEHLVELARELIAVKSGADYKKGGRSAELHKICANITAGNPQRMGELFVYNASLSNAAKLEKTDDDPLLSS